MPVNADKKKSLFFAHAIDKLVDPVRSTRWRLVIPTDLLKKVGIEQTNGDYLDEDEMTLHINGGMKLPDVKIKADKINYMGFEKKYPVQQNGLAGSFNADILLLEDSRAVEMMLGWNQSCLNMGVLAASDNGSELHENNRTANSPSGNNVYLGLGQQENDYGNDLNAYKTLLRNQVIRLELYDWMYGRVILSVVYINAWPSEVNFGGFGLDYATAKLGKFQVKFDYDRFQMFVNPGYRDYQGRLPDSIEG